MRRLIRFRGMALLLVALCITQNLRAGDAAADRRLYEETMRKGANFLITKGQAEDGSFSKAPSPAVTALAVTALLRSGRSPDDPAVQKGLKYLEKFVQPDGGIYQPGTNWANYETCLAMLCFSEANADKRYKDLLAKADAYVKKIQWDEEEGADPSDTRYGGAGYGSKKRPDLSNTHFFIEALRAAGNGEDDPNVKAALIFVSRCQNLESEHNTTPFPAKNPDGGFYYTVAGGGASEAGTTDNGGLRSYASMTYAGLKSMIFAGLTADDPRVKAAFEWAQKNYSLKENPGMGSAGLYYYYHTFAKALDAMKLDTITDASGKEHAWKVELVSELAGRQQPDGSWINENARWMEGDPNLVTSYALLTLAYCKPK